jgi:hypothetical protein
MRDIFNHTVRNVDGSSVASDQARNKAIRHWRKWVGSERDENRKTVILHAIRMIKAGGGEDSGEYFSITTEFGTFSVNAAGTEFSVRWK